MSSIPDDMLNALRLGIDVYDSCNGEFSLAARQAAQRAYYLGAQQANAAIGMGALCWVKRDDVHSVMFDNRIRDLMADARPEPAKLSPGYLRVMIDIEMGIWEP